MSGSNRVAAYLLIIPSPTVPMEQKKEERHYQRQNYAGSSPSMDCDCLVSVLAGLCLATLFVASIVVPLLVTLTLQKGETSSTSSTSSVTTIFSSTTTISSTSTVTDTTYTTSGSSSFTTDSSTTTDIPCLQTCASYQVCVHGTCVGIGYLSCTLVWSRNGDGDIVVATPNNNIIYWNNAGPSYYTDYGQLDVDNKNGTGPENIFWSNSSSVPPTGTYYVCFSQYSFNPNATAKSPIIATVKISRASSSTLVFTKKFVSYYQNYNQCDSSSKGFLGSFTYP